MATAKSHNLVMNAAVNGALVVEVFHIFLNTIRSDHPHEIYERMQNIMTCVIDDGDEMSPELVKPLLASVRRDNMIVSPAAWELGTAVIQKCAIKLKPLLQEAVRSMNLAIDDYADIVISLCRDTSSGEKMDDERVPEALQSDESVHNDGSLPGTLRSSEENVLSDTDEVTRCYYTTVDGFVIVDTSLPSYHGKKRTKTNLTHELAGPSDSLRQKFLSGACSSKGFHSKKKNTSLNYQAGESLRKPTKAMSDKKLSQEVGKKPETTAAVEYGDELVNRRIMVFWPADKTFYPGTVTSFEPVNTKHTVTYDDGDVEVLNLKDEKWKPVLKEFVQSYNEEEATHPPPAKESLKRSEKIEKRKTAPLREKHPASSSKRLKGNGNAILNSQSDSGSAQNAVLDADTPEDSENSRGVEEENQAGSENQTEPNRRISSRSTKGYHPKQRFGRFFS